MAKGSGGQYCDYYPSALFNSNHCKSFEDQVPLGETYSSWSSDEFTVISAGIILYMWPANERRRYNVTSSLIGWPHVQSDPCRGWECMCQDSSPMVISQHSQYGELQKILRQIFLKHLPKFSNKFRPFCCFQTSTTSHTAYYYNISVHTKTDEMGLS